MSRIKLGAATPNWSAIAQQARARMTTHFRIRKGHWPQSADAPQQNVIEDRAVQSAAFTGADFAGLRPLFEVSIEDRVDAGQVIFRDRKYPEIAFVAPFAGTISEISYGRRRTLSACVVQRGETKTRQFAGPVDESTETSIRQTLQSRGMWQAFRSRPFGHIPEPHARPAAIFVTATQSSPSAPDPHVVLAENIASFRYGVQLLTRLTEGLVHVCQPEGEPLHVPKDHVRLAVFGGSISAGLAGTHIDRIHPIAESQSVWTIGYQDVAAIGHLFQTGQYYADRVVSIAGPRARNPKLLRTCIGANIRDLCAGEVLDGDQAKLPAFLSGDALSGRAAAFLGRFHQQVTLTQKDDSGFLASWWSKFGSSGAAIIPTSKLENAVAVNVLPVPLMRALSVGDSEAAKRLGCLSLIEEDIAILSRLCTSGADYGVLLRQVLDELMEEAV